jgi:hypothetical protein
MMLFLSAWDGRAQEGCSITIEKVAPGAPDDLEFNFVGEDAGGPFEFFLTPGEPQTGEADFGEGFVNEVPPPGWAFGGIECEPGGGIIIVETETGWLQNCVNPQVDTFCTVFNESVTAIPTLSEWGMIAAVVGLGLVGVFFAIRKRKARVS